MKKSILLIGILTVGAMFSFHLENKQENVKTDKVLVSTISADYKYDYSNPRIIEEHSEAIAIIRIDSVDGVSNINETTGENTLPYTYGKATVISTLKGDIEKQTINYARLGGTMSFDNWILGEDNPEKIISLMETDKDFKNVDKENIKIETKLENDIEIEEGKVYLAYMNSTNDEFGDIDFTIIGVQYGLREIQEEVNNSTQRKVASKEIKVKNNDTEQWENLSKVISSN